MKFHLENDLETFAGITSVEQCNEGVGSWKYIFFDKSPEYAVYLESQVLRKRMSGLISHQSYKGFGIVILREYLI